MCVRNFLKKLFFQPKVLQHVMLYAVKSPNGFSGFNSQFFILSTLGNFKFFFFQNVIAKNLRSSFSKSLSYMGPMANHCRDMCVPQEHANTLNMRSDYSTHISFRVTWCPHSSSHKPATCCA